MSYTIIGGDGKEYGPIPDADLRQWIAEGRLNAQSLAKSVSDAEFRPLEKFPEFADIWEAGHALGTGPVLSSTAVSDEDYELDIGGCISRGWELLKNNFVTLFVSFLVLIGIHFAFSALLNLTVMGVLTKMFKSPAASVLLGFLVIFFNSLVVGPLLGGVYLVYLKTIRGEPTAVGEVFAGFQKAYARLFLGALIVGLLGGLCLAPFSFVLAEKLNPLVQQLQSAQMQNAAPADMGKILGPMMSAFASALPVLLICLIPMTYVTVCFQFTQALIIDKELKFCAAMKIGWQRVSRHWWQVFGLTILVGLLLLAGIFACGIGVVFTVPIGIAAVMFAYETIFSAKKY